MTINLTQAQKLQELGVRKKTQYCWIDEGKHFPPRLQLSIRCHGHPYAYNAEELIKLMRSKEHYPIDIYSHGDGFMFHHDNIDDIYGDSLTECLANELIYMLKNEIITAEEINGNSL